MGKSSFLLHMIVPVQQPSDLDRSETRELPLYEFDRSNCFIEYCDGDDSIFLDDMGQWYYYTAFACKSLTEVKYARQIFKPPYWDEEEKENELKLVHRLEEKGYKPSQPYFDKAYAHVTVLADTLEEWEVIRQSRLAHCDGEDDPQVSHALHFIETTYDGKRARFVPGWESNSFASITENKSFYDTILVPVSGKLYLLYYTYWLHYGEVPSKQMMPRLLGNLWKSSSSAFTPASYNPLLFQRIPLNTNQKEATL
ncbi:hypothetical protein ACFQPF_08310 [Fictibacillus iocasae]|uniref:Uncharacterized protein n=1 Tax=Fictibacillus iocasae TaxID=2715437 RepID=A0ABW2NQT3_9BACL